MGSAGGLTELKQKKTLLYSGFVPKKRETESSVVLLLLTQGLFQRDIINNSVVILPSQLSVKM